MVGRDPRETGRRTARRGTGPGGGRPGTPRRFLLGQAAGTRLLHPAAHGWVRCVLACPKSRADETPEPRSACEFFSRLLASRFRTIARSMAALLQPGRLSPELARETLWFLETNAHAIWGFQTCWHKELRR